MASQSSVPASYRVYGVSLQSPWPLPAPPARKAGGPEIRLVECPASFFARAAREASRRPNATRWFQALRLPDGSLYLRWSGLFEFQVSPDGRRIAGRPLERGSPESFQTYLLGQVLSCALLRRGIEPLHCTTVVVGGGAVGFAGDGGSGKSTLAAAFLRSGHPLLTDDLLVLKRNARGFFALPGLPRIKLFPRVARRLLGARARGVPMNDATPKLVIPLDERQSCRRPVPLRAIYVLARPSRRKAITIRTLSPRRAFLELTRNTFNTLLVEPQRLRRQFLLATSVARQVPVKRLAYPRALSSLHSVHQAILSDLAR